MATDDEFETYVKKVDVSTLQEITDENIIKSKIKRRGAKRSSLTKTIKKIDALPASAAELDIKFLLNKLEQLSKNISVLDEEIETFMLTNNDWTDRVYEDHSYVTEAYSDKAIRAINLLESLLHKSDSMVKNNSVLDNGNNYVTPKLKLPLIDMPKFSNEPEDFTRFKSSFEHILAKFDLTEFEKYMHLLQSTSGNARRIVESVPSGDLNYTSAMDLLKQAYSCETTQQYSVIEKIIKLKLNNSKNALKWISEARILSEQVTRLNINGDLFVQYFLWNGMSDVFKRQYIAITDSSKPDLMEIIENSFQVFDRISELGENSCHLIPKQEVPKSPQKTITLATNVSSELNSKPNTDYSCILCRESLKITSADHKIQNCNKFQSPKEKLAVITKLNGCVKCGLLNHTVQNCRYRFSGRCMKCKKYHAYFLCSTESGGEKGKSEVSGKSKLNSTRKVSTNAINFSVMKTSTNDSPNVIPTFTTTFRTNPNLDIRCMYDPASQASFITKSSCDKLNCHVIKENINVNIRGFNESKLITTKLVKLEASLNGEFREFAALVVPEITTSLRGNFAKVINAFSDAGIALADRLLGKTSDVDVLLGVDGAHVLPVHSCAFGKSRKRSAAYHTCLGVMIAGNLDNLQNNLSCLPNLKSFIDKFNAQF